MPTCKSGQSRIAKLLRDLNLKPNAEMAIMSAIGMRQQANIRMPCFLWLCEGAGVCDAMCVCDGSCVCESSCVCDVCAFCSNCS